MTEDLPLEMWEEVLYRNKDALLLWAGLRQTCRAFHDIIEHVFVKKMEIIIYGGMIYDDEYNKCLIEANFTFHKYSEDEKSVVFCDKSIDDSRTSTRSAGDDQYIKRWNSLIAERVQLNGNYCRPTCVIRIGELVNDTEIVGLKYDKEKFQITFDWRATLVEFFREEKEVANQDVIKTMEQKMGRKIAPTSDAEEIMAMMKLWASTTKDERGDIRKERMKRRFRAETGKELSKGMLPKGEGDDDDGEDSEDDDGDRDHVRFMRNIRCARENSDAEDESMEEEEEEREERGGRERRRGRRGIRKVGGGGRVWRMGGRTVVGRGRSGR